MRAGGEGKSRAHRKWPRQMPAPGGRCFGTCQKRRSRFHATYRKAQGVLAKEPENHECSFRDLVLFHVRHGLVSRELNEITFIGPLGFWFAAQGSLAIYVAVIVYYARTMNRLDDEYGVQEVEE